MYLKNIKILNFKNIKNLELNLNNNINIFIGKNAQGKTSILESIYYLALTKTFYSILDDNLINHDENFFKLRGNLIKKEDNIELEITYQKDNKKLKINKIQENKTSNYISLFNIIMFSPDDLDIVKKSPSFRRNLLNVELCQLYNEYLNILNEYNKVLKIRNEYIRKNYLNINKNYLDIITENLIDRAIIIIKYREEFINNINLEISKNYKKIMNQEGLYIKYENSYGTLNKNEILNIYSKNLESELNKKMTLYGPHRDDFIFILNNEDIKLYGSQGQQRVAILAFKLSEIKIFKNVKNEYPVVLLDDIFSELDIQKRNNLLKMLNKNIQYIITTTDIKNIDKIITKDSNIYKIKDGNIQNRSKK